MVTPPSDPHRNRLPGVDFGNHGQCGCRGDPGVGTTCYLIDGRLDTPQLVHVRCIRSVDARRHVRQPTLIAGRSERHRVGLRSHRTDTDCHGIRSARDTALSYRSRIGSRSSRSLAQCSRVISCRGCSLTIRLRVSAGGDRTLPLCSRVLPGCDRPFTHRGRVRSGRGCALTDGRRVRCRGGPGADGGATVRRLGLDRRERRHCG